MRKITF
jgi:hypothetical protein